MSTTYLISIIIFDDKHQRSNLLYHSGFILLKGDKDEHNHISNMEALGSYGFYSHPLPKKDRQLSIFSDQLLEGKMNLRLHSYAELKEEELTTVDLGFGLMLDTPVEISEDEKNRLVAKIERQYAIQNEFFKQADADALGKSNSNFQTSIWQIPNMAKVKHSKNIRI